MNVLWGTPQALFEKLDAEFHFNVDVCALPENAKCDRFYSPEIDGLKQSWTGVCWMNPPFGRGIEKWLEKAYLSASGSYRRYLEACTVVALVPTRTNAPWWHDWVMKAHEIRFIRKKVSFVGVKNGVAFTGHAIVVFRSGIQVGCPIVSSYDQPKSERPRMINGEPVVLPAQSCMGSEMIDPMQRNGETA